jgi:hypothetical protein
MAARNPVFEDGVYHDAESFGLLPDPTKEKKLSWVRVRGLVAKAEVSPPLVGKQQIDRLLSIRNSREFGDLSEEIWPPRTKTDLALRRTRLLDWVKYYRANARMHELREILTATREGWDLIFVTNLVAGTAVLGLPWWKRWKWLGAYDGDLTHYTTVAKKVHDLGKSSGLQEEQWTWFVECGTMAGYRNPPFPGFDIDEQAAALANGGEEHNYFGHTWQALVSKFLPMRLHPASYTPFADWVKGATWLTSGASSVGRLKLELADGKEISVKARKNMVADVYDLGDLATEAVANEGQQNYTIVKSELGKLRLAVAGDIYTYLKMTWINNLLGGAYYDWPGNTSEEDFEQQTKRLAKMLELCAKGFGLPYDYAGFDHQPTTLELVGIVEHLCAHARLNVPAAGHKEFDSIVKNVITGFRHSTLKVRLPDGEEKIYPVTGGLMSGLRWTSVVGNGWNSVVTGLALELLQAWGIPTSKIERFIRGDDSAIFVENWATGAAMNVAYDAIGAKAGEGKFSLQYQGMEFLRVWFDTRCHGYPARAIPGLTQRKPWSANPWSEDMVMRALYEATRTLRRRASSRTADIDKIWRTLRHVWCRNHNLPDAACWTPEHAGGLGIEPMPLGESWHITPPIPRALVTGVGKPLNQTSWRRDNLTEYAAERYGLEIGERADEIAVEELLSTVTSDNVPAVAREVRQSWLQAVRTAGCRAIRTKVSVAPLAPAVVLNCYRPDQIDLLLGRLRAEAPLYGVAPEIAVARADYARFRPKIGFQDWLRQHFPRVALLLRRFHSSWHVSERLDYLQGKLLLAPRRLHPALVGVLALVVAGALKPSRKAVRNASLWSGGVFEEVVLVSPLAQETYNW